MSALKIGKLLGKIARHRYIFIIFINGTISATVFLINSTSYNVVNIIEMGAWKRTKFTSALIVIINNRSSAII